MTDRDSATERPRGVSPRVAVVLSAAVAPGIGQVAQGRWVAGGLFLAGFLAAFALGVRALLAPLLANWRSAIAFAGGAPDAVLRPIPIGQVMGWTGLALAVYLASLADAWRAGRAWERARLERRRRALPAEIGDGHGRL